ncbi:MAG: hypothetical protein K2N64_05125 [Anaeroplasmataceae bacterium]|nr:hypothetical protein [Anaeroplasmataceae bacterium]
MKFSKEILKLFRDDLCKDQREIEILPYPDSISGKIMRKYNTSKEEYATEIEVINFLLQSKAGCVPRIFGNGSILLEDKQEVSYLDIEYFDGIRVYNVLAYLRKIDKMNLGLNEQTKELKTFLYQRCRQNQINIQSALIKLAQKKQSKKIYPQQKLVDLVKMLCEIMKLDIHEELFSHDLPYIINEFNRMATVPFRDSTTKNMVLYYPKLYLEHYLDVDKNVLMADEKRLSKFVEMLKSGEYKDLLNCPIIDFDFSSCQDLTSKYDDPIGFSCHEINWLEMPKAKDLIWNNKDFNIDGKEIAITFIIRFLRFGGRKMAYHILHPNAYRYRFKYDDENFYFNHLNDVVNEFWPQAKKEIPCFIKFVEQVIKFDKTKIIDEVDEFELEFPNCNRKFYVDIFPY